MLKPYTSEYLETLVTVITDPRTILWFGKYQNHSILEVLDEDPDYLVWAQENVDSLDLHFSLLETAERDIDRTRWEILSEYHWR